MAEELPPASHCDSCNIFGWKQPRDRSSIKRCSRCKVVSYCSEQCQKEHCKYLVATKVLHSAKHNDAYCLQGGVQD